MLKSKQGGDTTVSTATDLEKSQTDLPKINASLKAEEDPNDSGYGSRRASLEASEVLSDSPTLPTPTLPSSSKVARVTSDSAIPKDLEPKTKGVQHAHLSLETSARSDKEESAIPPVETLSENLSPLISSGNLVDKPFVEHLKTYIDTENVNIDVITYNSIDLFYIQIDPFLKKIGHILKLYGQDFQPTSPPESKSKAYKEAYKLLQNAFDHKKLDDNSNIPNLDKIISALDVIINDELHKHTQINSEADEYELWSLQLSTTTADEDIAYKLLQQKKSLEALKYMGYQYRTQDEYKTFQEAVIKTQAPAPPTETKIEEKKYELDDPFFKKLSRHDAQRILTAKLDRFNKQMELAAFKNDKDAAEQIKKTLDELAKVKIWWNAVEFEEKTWFGEDKKLENQEEIKAEILTAATNEVAANIFWTYVFIMIPTLSAAILNGWSGDNSLQDTEMGLTNAFIAVAATASGTTNGLNNFRSAYFMRTIKSNWDNFKVSVNPFYWFHPGVLISTDGEVKELSASENRKLNIEVSGYASGSALLVTMPILVLTLFNPVAWLIMLYMIPSYILMNRFQSESFLNDLFGKMSEKVFGKREHWWEYLTTNLRWASIFLVIGGIISPIMGYVIFGKFLAAVLPYLGTSLSTIVSGPGLFMATALLPVLLLVLGVALILLAYFCYSSELSTGVKSILWAMGILGLIILALGITALLLSGVGIVPILIMMAATLIGVDTGSIVFKLLGNSAITFASNWKKFMEILAASYASNPTATVLLAFIAIPLFVVLAGLNALVYGALSIFGLEGTLPFLTIFGENSTGKPALFALFGFSIGLALGSILAILTILFKPLATAVLNFSPELKRLLYTRHHTNPFASALLSISLTPIIVALVSIIPLALWLIPGIIAYAIAGIRYLCGGPDAEFEVSDILKLSTLFKNVIDPAATFLVAKMFNVVFHYSNFIFNALIKESYDWLKNDNTFNEAYEKNWAYAVFVAVPVNALICTGAAIAAGAYGAVYLAVGALWKTVTGIIDAISNRLFSSQKKAATSVTSDENTAGKTPTTSETLNGWKKARKSIETCMPTPSAIFKNLAEAPTQMVNKAAPTPLFPIVPSFSLK